MFGKGSQVLKFEYTYKDLTKPVNREYMQLIGISSLGTQSGGFGKFTPHFIVISNNSIDELREEIKSFCLDQQAPIEWILDGCPLLNTVLNKG